MTKEEYLKLVKVMRNLNALRVYLCDKHEDDERPYDEHSPLAKHLTALYRENKPVYELTPMVGGDAECARDAIEYLADHIEQLDELMWHINGAVCAMTMTEKYLVRADADPDVGQELCDAGILLELAYVHMGKAVGKMSAERWKTASQE